MIASFYPGGQIRRYFRTVVEYTMGAADKDTVDRVKLLMDGMGLKPEDRPVVVPAR